MPEGALREADISTRPGTIDTTIWAVSERRARAPRSDVTGRRAVLVNILDIASSGYSMTAGVRRYFEECSDMLADYVRYVQDGTYRLGEYSGRAREALNIYFRFFPHRNARPDSPDREETATPNSTTTMALTSGANLVVAQPTTQYLTRLKEAVTFLRRNSSRRYSDSQLGSLMRKVDVCEERVASINGRHSYFDADYRMPTLLIVGDEPGYDEETEVKTGGIIGVAIIIPSLDESPSKVLMAVKESRRREGIGTKLMAGFRQVMPTYNTVTYVSATNTTGLLFAIDAGFLPAELTPNGVMQLRYDELRSRAERE